MRFRPFAYMFTRWSHGSLQGVGGPCTTHLCRSFKLETREQVGTDRRDAVRTGSKANRGVLEIYPSKGEE